MSRMDDSELLNILQKKEDDAAAYVYGELGAEREQALREYHRQPYGNEEEGWSQIVSSDIQDSVEWVLAAIMKTFASTDKAVQFEPSRAADVEPAEQATDACNYVFYKQNNGFLVLYTAVKDMLTVKNCAVMWRKETNEVVSTVPFKQATQEMLAMLMNEDEAEIQEVREEQVVGPDGLPITVYSGRLKKSEEKTIVKVEAFSPEDLLVQRDWTSPLLDDCPYVARIMRVNLTDLHMMGFTQVTAEDLRASDADKGTDIFSSNNNWQDRRKAEESDDDAMAEGFLRVEYVLIDADGDGIAERMCVYRLQNMILSAEVCSHVQIATASPVLNTHRWDGMSFADLVSDLQKLHTELLRQTLNNLYLTNNPRKKVLTDSSWSPLANIDDLLDSRVGGLIRMRDVNAVQEDVTPFAAGASMPMLEYVQGMRENRTGVSRVSMGLNPDSLNNTATGRAQDMTAAMQRTELIVRIIAETLVKPIFRGILKLLTDGGMEKLAFRLRDQFVEYDPNEWRDQYDMTINVGIGTGDKAQQAATLMSVWQMQQAGMQFGLATPKHLYATASKVIENAGFKDIQNFIQDPSTVPPQPPQPPIPLQIEQMKLQADAQKTQAQMQADIQRFQAESQIEMQKVQAQLEAKLKETRASLELQAANDVRDSQREQMKAQLDAQLEAQKIEFERRKAELQAQTQIYLEQLKQGAAAPIDTGGDINNALAAAIEGIRATMETMNRPKTIIRGPDGRAAGIA